MKKTVEELLAQFPEGQILRLKADKEIEQCAKLEAEMTFMKSQREENAAELIYMYPDIVKTKEDLFLFAMTFGRHLTELGHKLRRVSPQVIEMFQSQN